MADKQEKKETDSLETPSDIMTKQELKDMQGAKSADIKEKLEQFVR